jgi:hypothetical protein
LNQLYNTNYIKSIEIIKNFINSLKKRWRCLSRSSSSIPKSAMMEQSGELIRLPEEFLRWEKSASYSLASSTLRRTTPDRFLMAFSPAYLTDFKSVTEIRMLTSNRKILLRIESYVIL